MPTIITTDVHDMVYVRVKGLITLSDRQIKAMVELLKEVYGSNIRLNGNYTKSIGYIYKKNLLGKQSEGTLSLYVFIKELYITDFTAKLKVSMYDIFEHRDGHGSKIFWKLDEKYKTPLELIRGNIRRLSDEGSNSWTMENR